MKVKVSRLAKLAQKHYFGFSEINQVQQVSCPIVQEIDKYIQSPFNQNQANQKYFSRIINGGYLPLKKELYQIQQNHFGKNEVDQRNFIHESLEEMPIVLDDPIYYTYLIDANNTAKYHDQCLRLITQCFLKNIVVDVQCYIDALIACENLNVSYSLLIYSMFKQNFTLSYSVANKMINVLPRIMSPRIQEQIKQEIVGLTGNDYLKRKLNKLKQEKIQQLPASKGYKPIVKTQVISKDKYVLSPIKQTNLKLEMPTSVEIQAGIMKFLKKNGNLLVKESNELYSETDESDDQDDDDVEYTSDDEVEPLQKLHLSRRNQKHNNSPHE